MNKSDRIARYRATLEYLPEEMVIPVDELNRLGFFDAPASTRYHGAYEGGLFDHSLAVAEKLSDLTVDLSLNWSRPGSPLIIGLYHDLCKVDTYKRKETGIGWEYAPNPWLPGHGDKSLIIAGQYIRFTEEEIACIRWHMGAYETDPKMWQFYGSAIERFPNVLYTHTADMIVSKIEGV